METKHDDKQSEKDHIYEHDILTIEEAADYLRMHVQTLRRKAAAGTIPGKKPAKRWLFSKRELHGWLEVENQRKNGTNADKGSE